MSMAALKWAREPRPGLGATATAVLRDLADRASESGVCWPAVATIAAETNLSRRTVQRALRRLEQERLITVKQTGRGSRYTLAGASLLAQLVTSEASESHLRGVTVTLQRRQSDAQSLKKPKEPRRKPPARAAAAAYEENIAAPTVTIVDEQMIQLARGWLEAHDA